VVRYLCLFPVLASSVPFLYNFTVRFDVYTLSLHDALPISAGHGSQRNDDNPVTRLASAISRIGNHPWPQEIPLATRQLLEGWLRSEEHTSELQSRFDLVCRLLLEKKKNTLDVNLLSRDKET